MRLQKPIEISLLLSLAAAPIAFPQDALSLWYKQPAAEWVDALPVGNGCLGGMVFGGIARERIQFNEHTVWTGNHTTTRIRERTRRSPRSANCSFRGSKKTPRRSPWPNL